MICLFITADGLISLKEMDLPAPVWRRATMPSLSNVFAPAAIDKSLPIRERVYERIDILRGHFGMEIAIYKERE